MPIDVKICGLQDKAALHAVVESGAKYVGLVFCTPSRHRLTIEQARPLALDVPEPIKTVGLFVDPTNEELQEVTQHVPLRVIQLHGHETPARVAEIRAMTGLAVMKAIHVGTAEDLDKVLPYEPVADLLLFDTKIGAQPTGGTGKTFNWEILKGRHFSRPWMLAGGIRVSNLAEAVAVTGARIVDLSSGVEDLNGHKDPAKIKELLELAKKS